MGLAFILMSIIRNQAITFVLILGYIGITLFLFQAKYYYIFDYMAFNIPMVKSAIVGFGNIDVILAHRGIYFFLGMGFISMSIFLLKRLPQSETMTFLSLIFAIVFISGGVYLGYQHLNQFQTKENIRAEMIEVNNKYVNENFPDVISNSINLEHIANTINVVSELELQNNTDIGIYKYIFTLNDGLTVSEILVNGTKTDFERDHHLVLTNSTQALAPGEKSIVKISYSGTINETLCYLDVDEETMQEKYGDFVINIDKRFAFVNPDYVLLTSESFWYPKPGVSYSPNSIKWVRQNFSDYKLTVKTDPSLQAVSQGKITSVEPGSFTFENENLLTQISLAIGDYEHKSFDSEGLEFGIWNLKGHDFFSEALPDIMDTIPSVITERFKDFQRTYNLQYSFKRLALVEVPAQFKSFERIWTSNQEFVQPEQILIPEKGCLLRDADFRVRIKREERNSRRREAGLTKEEMQIRVLNNFAGNFTREQGRPDFNRGAGGTFTADEKANQYFIFPFLYSFQNNIQSEQWPITNRIFEGYLKNQSEDMRSAFMRNLSGMSEDELANIALQDYTFEEILADPEQKKIIDNVIKMKGDVLFTMIQWKAGEAEFEAFLRELLNKHKFQNIKFEDFSAQIQEKFGLPLEPMMDEWFKEKSLPGYLFSPIDAKKVKSGDQIKTMISLKTTNFSDKEGVIKLSFRLGGGGRGPGGFRGGGGGPGADNTIDKIVYLEGNQTKELSYLLDADPRMLTINTLTSKNIPQTIMERFMDIDEDEKAKPSEGEKISDIAVSEVLPNEIIVDNEDPEFEITENTSGSLLTKWVLKEEESKQKYAGYSPWRPPSSWTATTNSGFYGKYVRSGYYIKSGEGDQKATWNVPIKEGSYYDIYYHVYKAQDFRRGQSSSEKGEYNFTIFHDDGQEEQTLDISSAEAGWNHLGSFFFSPDTAKIQLSNKSQLRTVFADAVKLVKL